MLDENLPFHKEGREQCVKEPGKANKVLFAPSHSSDGCAQSTRLCSSFPGSIQEDQLCSMLCTFPCMQSEDWVPQAIQGLSVNPRCMHLIGCNPRILQPI